MIKGQYTPWDEDALKIKTFEILEVDTREIDRLRPELESNSFCDADLIYGRFPANDLLLKELLIKSGYIPCETSFRVTLSNINNYTLPKIYTRRLLSVQELESRKFNSIAEIASNMFKFSRFHEDPFIDNKLADERMYKWVKDLEHQNVKCLVSKSKNRDIISFMIYKIDEFMQVELILGGSKKGFEMHSPFFWGGVINYFKLNGVIKISTTISAANSGVLSLYQNLGFKIVKTCIDYHKHI